MKSLIAAITVVLLSSAASGGDELVPCRERFAADTAEVPDFQRHVVPLLGKLGCNGRACHGSFQGRGGFRLSLFGYDFDMDHQGLSERIDLEQPAQSYALHKPTLQEPHEGGKRFDVGGWEYRILLNWIRGGAQPRADGAAALTALEVTPREIVFESADEQRPLRAVAVWSDGAREDVTCLCRFQSNDESIAVVDAAGVVTAGAVGDTHVVVLYDNAVVPVPVLRPVSDLLGERYPVVAAPTAIDEFVVQKLKKLGIVPSEVCNDAEFLRRVSLDIAGTLPTADEVRAFLSDTSADKRARKIDELLKTPAYAAWWTTRLCDWTGNSPVQLGNASPVVRYSAAGAWYEWIYQRVANNVPYDELVEGIVEARGRREEESYREYCERLSAIARGEEDHSYADEPGLIFFWGRRNFASREDRAVGFAYTFMGTRIQCAQCHKHPFDVWTQSDFEQFERFFGSVQFARNGGANREFNEMLEEIGAAGKRAGELRRAVDAAAREGKTVPFPDVIIARRGNRRGEDGGRERPPETARLLGGAEIDLSTLADPRTALMDWLRHDEKRLFAKAFVNRVWANYFHRGIVEPTDDLSLGNPPPIDGLLDHLANGFVDSGYDMRWVHREICNSATYQRSWTPNDTNLHDERNFSRAVPRRLPAEVAYDALLIATASRERAATFADDLDGRMVAYTSRIRNDSVAGPDYALTVFGRSARANNCDCDRSEDASLLQTVFLRNDAETLRMIDRQGGWIAEVTAELSGKPAAADDSADGKGAARRNRRAADQRIQQLQVLMQRARRAGDKAAIARLRSVLQQARQAAADRNRTEDEPAPSRNIAIVNAPDVTALVEEAYLRTVSRFPTEEEQLIAGAYIVESEDPISGLHDLLWSLVNTKEFIVNH